MMKKNITLIIVIVIAALTLLGALLICKSPFSSQRDVESDIRARSQLREMRNGEGPEEMRNGKGPEEMRNGKGPEEMRNGKGPEEMRNGKGPEEMRNGEGPEEMRNGDKRNSEGYDGRNRPPEMGGIMKYPREFYSHRKEYFHF